jgi:UDP-N-acetylglucosamine 2-epimerase (non-hydrolysing)
MKVAPLLTEIQQRPSLAATLIHTGQHFSADMSDAFFRDLGIRSPDVHLGIGGGSHAQQTAEIMKHIEPVFQTRRPDLLIVVGDVNSTVAAALVASKMGIAIAHVEAGLRSFDRSMPEEINRLVTDAISDYLFTSEPSGTQNLLAEGRPAGSIFEVGNVMIDTLLRFRETAANSTILTDLGLESQGYAVLTLHRPANVDEPVQMRRFIEAVEAVSDEIPVVFPVHPRTRQALDRCFTRPLKLRLTPPLGYLDFLQLMSNSRMMITDSGGIQEETTALGVPCITVRNNTERPITVEHGTNRLIGTDPDKIAPAVRAAMTDERKDRCPKLWDGRASARICDVIETQLDDRSAA